MEIFNSVLRETAHAIIPNNNEAGDQTNLVDWVTLNDIIRIEFYFNATFFLQIKKELERRSRFSISKTKVAGSFGKKVTIISSDIDIVIFIKNVLPPFTGVLDEFERILMNMDGIAIRGFIHNLIILKKTSFSLQFKIGNYEFDLVPAADLINEPNVGAHEQVLLQQQRTLNKISKNVKKNLRRYSSSLAFSTIEFMKTQSSFVHEIVRLAKFWYKGACIDTYVSGAKYAMELIAVEAATHVESHGYSYPHYEAFLRFLESIRDFKSMDIVFDYTYISRKHWQSDDDEYVRLLDPANPYNNLADGFFSNEHVIDNLVLQAEEILENVGTLQLQASRGSSECELYQDILMIFYPDLFDIIENANVHISITDDPVSGLKSQWWYKNFRIRKPKYEIDEFNRRQIEFLHIYLTGLCEAIWDSYDWSESSMKQFVNYFFSRLQQYGLEQSKSFNKKYKCNDFDVTLGFETWGKFRFSFDLADGSEAEPGSEVGNSGWESEYSDSSTEYSDSDSD